MRLDSAFIAIPAVLAVCGVAVAAPLEPREDNSCSAAGALICNADLTQFALCNPPAAPIWQAVAPGTTCTPTGGSSGLVGGAPAPSGAPPALQPASTGAASDPVPATPVLPTRKVDSLPVASDVKNAALPIESGSSSPGGTAVSSSDVAAAVSAIPLSNPAPLLKTSFGGGAPPTYGKAFKGSKRKVAYWQLSDGVKQGTPWPSYDSLEGLTHLILFSVSMKVYPPTLDLNLERIWPTDVIAKAREKNIAVMAAFGGWDMDQTYKELTNSAQAIAMGVQIADFAIDNELDGIDIDDEYVLESQVAFWPDLINSIRARCIQRSVADMIISIALPAVPANGIDDSAAVVEQVLAAYTAPLFERIDTSVDFYNMMTYDMLNRYDKGKKAQHQASLNGTLDTIKYYSGVGLSPQKLNSGTPVYPKWFPMAKCDTPNGLGCLLDADITEDNSGANRFRAEYNWKNPTWAADKAKHPSYDTSFDNSLKSMQKYITKDGTVGAPNAEYYDPRAKADTYYDKDLKIFWTWQGPEAIAETCKGVIDSDIGGQMIFAVGMDSTDLPHWDAWMGCVRGWK